MNEDLDRLREELARQDAELAEITKQLEELAGAGVAIGVPSEFFEALDEACTPRPKFLSTPAHGLRA